ncbi:MAG: Integral membrane protein MviN [Candidatus Moranbacteria bacterium GW2011_GWA2_39_41]|nr:MAG: Integral membrane protein MviN [Candidatus Moranbacteria bacterium GW2011_GWA2_39_41]
MIQKLLKDNFLMNSRPTESVISAAFVITVAGLLSNLLGLVRDRMLASTFGAGDTLDVYYAAFRVPDLIYNLLILGAMSAAFIPVLTGLRSQDNDEEAWKLTNGIMNLALLFIVLISAVCAIFTPFLMKLLTPGFSPEKIESVVLFTRIMFLSPILLGISGIMGGVLTSMKHFIVYSVAPLLYNIGIIFGIAVLVRFLGAVGLAWGVVFGALIHMLLQYVTVRKLGYKHSWEFVSAWKNKNVRKVFTLMLPRMTGIAISQFNLMIITIFASTLAAGSLAVFNFSQNLASVPFSVFGISFSIAVFPTLAALAAKDEKEKFVQAFSETFRQILFFVIPLSVFMIVLRAQIVRVVLGAGKFDWEDTILTFQCLGILAFSLFAQSAVQLLARSFYALQDTKTPFYIAIVVEAINIIAVVLLIGHVQILSLAIAFSLANIVQMFLLLFFLRARFDNLDDKNIIRSLSKIAVASIVAGIGIQITKYGIASLMNLDTFLGVFVQLVISLTVGFAIFIGISHFLRLEEFILFRDSFTRKIFKNKQIILESTEEVSGI